MIWLAGGIVLAASAAAIAFLRRRYVAVRVRGTSMTPALRDGDRVLVTDNGTGCRQGAKQPLARPWGSWPGD